MDNKNWAKGYALFKRQWGGVYWTGTVGKGPGRGPMWTRAMRRARTFRDLPSAYEAAKDIRELQECVPVRVIE